MPHRKLIQFLLYSFVSSASLCGRKGSHYIESRLYKKVGSWNKVILLILTVIISIGSSFAFQRFLVFISLVCHLHTEVEKRLIDKPKKYFHPDRCQVKTCFLILGLVFFYYIFFAWVFKEIITRSVWLFEFIEFRFIERLILVVQIKPDSVEEDRKEDIP